MQFRYSVFIVIAMIVFGDEILADWSYDDCPNVSDADFRLVTLVAKSAAMNGKVTDGPMMEPLEMDLISDDEGGVDIYYVERRGKLKFYDASANTLSTIGTLDVFHGNNSADCGLTGIVLDPDFKETHWIYLFHTPTGASPEVYRLSRFTLKDNNLDMDSQKDIFEAEIRYNTQWHTGGSMKFDAYGDLWIACGKNSSDDPNSINENNKWLSAEFGSSNTHSVRGGIMRITPKRFPDSETPTPGIGSTYDIPKGNFGDYFALLAEKDGNDARADEFRNTDLVLPEVFAKGARNPWTMTVEPVKRWVAWGENGVNRGGLHEEHNITKVPGFFGYPYFAGDNLRLTDQLSVGDKDPNAPTNTSKWAGLEVLPPAIPAIHYYRQSSAMTGPIYRYDGDLDSDIKFPPHFDGMWFLFDFNRGDNGRGQDVGVTKVAKLDDDLEEFVDFQDIFQAPRFNLYGVLEAEMGPDGALYVINYAGWFNSNQNTNIARFEYTGDCHPAEPKLEEVADPNVYYPPPGYGCTDVADPNYDREALAHDSLACAGSTQIKDRLSAAQVTKILQNQVYFYGTGLHSVSVIDTKGRRRQTFTGNGRAVYTLEAPEQPGVYMISVSYDNEVINQKVVLY